MNKTIIAAIISLMSLCCSVALAAEPATFARFVPERLDDFAWENDLIAFRAYGPAMRPNAEDGGIDCWLKRVDYPIVNKWYHEATKLNKTYHKDDGEGLDNYHVGASAGCGGTALWMDGERRGLNTYTAWDVIKCEKNETVFKLTYENTIDGSIYKEEKTITITLGDRLFRAESVFYKDGKRAVDLPIVIGVTTHDGKAKPFYDVKKGWIACWEVLDGDGLGTAVMVAPKDLQEILVQVVPAKKDRGHIMMLVKTDKSGTIRYAAGYGWEKAKQITTSEAWTAYLNDFKF